MPNSHTSNAAHSMQPSNESNDQSALGRLEQRQLYQYQTMGDELYLDEANYDNADDDDFDVVDITGGQLHLARDSPIDQ